MAIQVAYDATGAGAHGTANSGTTTISWTHTLGASASAVIVGVTGFVSFTEDTDVSRSVQIGSQPLTLLGMVNNDNAVFGDWGWTELWGLAGAKIANLAGTTQTITVSEGAAFWGSPAVAGNSVSYTNVIKFGTAVTNFGQTTSVSTGTITSKTGDLVVSVAGMYNGSLASASGAARFDFTQTGDYISMLIQDTAGSSSVTETCSGTVAQPWGTVGTDLNLGAVMFAGLSGHGGLTASAHRAFYHLSGAGSLTAAARMYSIDEKGPFLGQGGLTALTEQIVPLNVNLHGKGSFATVPYTNLVFFEVTGNFQAVADPTVSGVLNAPVIQPINAIVTFTPRLPKGQLCYMSNYLVTPAYNALQVLTLIGNVTGGTWTVEFGSRITDALAYDITPTDLQAALEGLDTIGANNVVVTVGIAPFSYNVEFTKGLGNQQMPPLIGNGDDLSNPEGPGFCEVTTTITLEGSNLVAADTAIALPPLTARIFEGVLSTIDLNDSPGFQLTANSGSLGLNQELIYDVNFTNITFNQGNQTLAPFAFVAPEDSTPVCITSPDLNRLNYQAPSVETVWQPQPVGTLMVDPNNMTARRPGAAKNWRQREAEQQQRRRLHIA